MARARATKPDILRATARQEARGAPNAAGRSRFVPSTQTVLRGAAAAATQVDLDAARHGQCHPLAATRADEPSGAIEGQFTKHRAANAQVLLKEAQRRVAVEKAAVAAAADVLKPGSDLRGKHAVRAARAMVQAGHQRHGT